MPLTIHRLETLCRAPAERQQAVHFVDRVARERLGAALGEFLGPSLDRQAAVVRLRSLHVQVEIPASQLNERALLEAWAAAFGESLFRALAYPSGEGPGEIARYESAAAYRAALVRQLIFGGRSTEWQFEGEMSEEGGRPAALALLLLLESREQLFETVAELEQTGTLERLLGEWDEHAMERIFAALAEGQSAATGEVTLEDALRIATFAAGVPLVRGRRLAGRQQALRIALAAWRQGVRESPRAVYHVLLAVTALLEYPAALADPDAFFARHSLPPGVQALLRRIAAATAGLSSATSPEWRRTLEALRPLVPTAAPASAAAQPQASVPVETAGLFLLAAIVHRLGFDDLMRDPLLAPYGGPRAFQFLLAAIASAIVREFHIAPRLLDTGVALFAGLGPEPDLASYRRFLDSVTPRDRAALAARLLPQLDGPSEWPALTGACAGVLVAAFAERVRGFRRAPHDAIVRQFLRVPGRILTEDTRMQVVLDPSPWNLALHVSGMDDTVEDVPWLGGRRLQLLLEGL